MTDFTAMFDTLGVKTTTTGKLFYGKFPFKIAINDPVERPKWRNGFSYYSPTYQAEIDRYQQARATFMRKRYRTIPCTDPKDWRWMDNQGVKTLSYFFMNADDALSFCVKNKAHLRSITRPESQLMVDALNTIDETELKAIPVVRDYLFWNRYRYCIQFKRTDEAREAADEFYEAHHRDYADDDRSMYNHDHDRRLYLNDLGDVFFAKMGVGEYFKTFQKAILKSDISHANEPATGPQAD